MSGQQGFGGFYTRQEQEDVLTARIDNPNRIGSGFINYGPQERNVQGAANWQTASLLGGGASAPQTVSDIWASSNPTVHPEPQRLVPPPPQPQIHPFAAHAQPFSAAAAPPRDVNALLQSLHLDSAPQQPQQMAQPPKPPTPLFSAGAAGASAYAGLGLNSLASSALQQPFLNGLTAGQATAAQQQSLMMLLQQSQTPQLQPPVSASLAPVYGGLGNGSVPQVGVAASNNRIQAFSNPPSQCQLPANGCAHTTSFNPGAFASSQSRPTAAPRAAPAPPKSLQSAADYAAAAQSYKPPVASVTARSSAPVVGLGRKPELSKAVPASGAPVEKEWECPRCTFLNNSSLWECEMCAFERPGKATELQANSEGGRGHSHEDDGWKSAGASNTRKAAPLPGALAATGKSKTQSKNEKRRAKKRGE